PADLLAGVTANLILGIIIFTIVFTVGLPQFAAKPAVSEVANDSPAMEAGFEEGQTIIALNGQQFDQIEGGFAKAVSDNAGDSVKVTVESEDGQKKDIEVTPRKDPPAGQGALGVTLGGGELYIASTEKYPIHQAWLEGIKQ